MERNNDNRESSLYRIEDWYKYPNTKGQKSDSNNEGDIANVLLTERFLDRILSHNLDVN